MALDEVISQNDVISTSIPLSSSFDNNGVVRRFVSEGKLPHMLFYGPAGTGKTSTAVALANTIFGPRHSGKVLELNASDERGIDVVREQIKTFAGTRNLFAMSANPNEPAYKLIILDECDAMTSTAQNALRRGIGFEYIPSLYLLVMEKYVKHVRFILICNYASQLIPAIQSRCTRFRFSPIGREGCLSRLERVVQAEGLNVTQAAREALLTLSKGDMRRVLNVLQAAAATVPPGTAIDESLIYAVTAAPHPNELDRILECLMTCTDFQTGLNTVKAVQMEHALALQDIVGALFDRVNALELPPAVRLALTRHLADLEHRLTLGTNEVIQLQSLVALFMASRCFTDVTI